MADQTTSAANKEFVREFIERVFNEHNASLTGNYFSTDVKWHGGSVGTIEGSAAMTEFYATLFTGLPDLNAATLDIAAEGDTVWCRFVVEGTNESSLFGLPATHKTVRWDEIDMYRFENGKIVEEWSSPDFTNVLHQLGAYTPPWIS